MDIMIVRKTLNGLSPFFANTCLPPTLEGHFVRGKTCQPPSQRAAPLRPISRDSPMGPASGSFPVYRHPQLLICGVSLPSTFVIANPKTNGRTVHTVTLPTIFTVHHIRNMSELDVLDHCYPPTFVSEALYQLASPPPHAPKIRLPLLCRFVPERYSPTVASHLLCHPTRWNSRDSMVDNALLSSVDWLQVPVHQLKSRFSKVQFGAVQAR